MRLTDYGYETSIWEPLATTPDLVKEVKVATIPGDLPVEEVLKLYPHASSITYTHHGFSMTIKVGQP